MKAFQTGLVLLVLWPSAMVSAAQAGKPIAYPAKQQSSQQQVEDDGGCLAWAKQTTGIDPAAVSAAPAAPPQPHGERLGGAARGALAGAAVGEIVDGDSSKGASVGAVGGVLAGGARARHHAEAQAQQAQAAKTTEIDTYYRAYASCMQGRGYTVQ